MMVLNSITHPVWMFPSILLLVFGQGRWVLPPMVFVIGVHFVPMARILARRIDYLLGPVTIIAAIIAGILALDEQVSWLVAFAVAGIGGAIATHCYALYLAREYRRLCERADVSFPVGTPDNISALSLTTIWFLLVLAIPVLLALLPILANGKDWQPLSVRQASAGASCPRPWYRRRRDLDPPALDRRPGHGAHTVRPSSPQAHDGDLATVPPDGQGLAGFSLTRCGIPRHAPASDPARVDGARRAGHPAVDRAVGAEDAQLSSPAIRVSWSCPP